VVAIVVRQFVHVDGLGIDSIYLRKEWGNVNKLIQGHTRKAGEMSQLKSQTNLKTQISVTLAADRITLESGSWQ
jgi:hypothetical protein